MAPVKSDTVARGHEDWLEGGGEMGKLVRAKDWSQTPLGPLSSWPQSLRTTVSLCLASNFPISLVWGPRHIQIYNDGYWPICGGKHPASMGQDFTECWASAWPQIGEAFENALQGRTAFLENVRMFLDRNGYLEETFFTFSFSPIRDESGGIGGLFHPVTETTGSMLSERRARSLRDIAARTVSVDSPSEVLRRSSTVIAEYDLDVPFAIFYLLDDQRAQRIVLHGIDADSALAPRVLDLTGRGDDPWDVRRVLQTQSAHEQVGLCARFGSAPCGPYPEPPERALVLPIKPPGQKNAAAIVVLGLSSRLPVDDVYRTYLELVAACVTTALASALAYEAERKRAEALAEIDRAKTAFFSNISHEFRTPLTLMLGPLEDELGEPERLPDARRERLLVAHRNALRLLKLVNTLLDFSRIEAGRTEASFEPVDLAALTRELASVFRSAMERGGLAYEVDCPPLPEPIYVDRDMWEKVVLNLLSNAFKHTFTGRVGVRLRWSEQGPVLAVEDSGVGIAADDLPHLFERFHRVRGARSRTHEGTGIGLALVRELVQLHGGAVSAASREGHGTTFTVTLPRGCAHLSAGQVRATRTQASTSLRAASYVEEALHWLPRADEALPPPPNVLPASQRPRLIWADDNADMRDYVQRLLGERYDVLAVPDGKAALEAALESPPALVLSDVMMPVMDGFALLHALRSDARTRTIPVILLSARAGEEAALSGLDAGADDYLAKPFSARELLTRVRTHVELAAVRHRCGEELELANKELEAFSYSVSHDLRAPLRAIEGFTNILLEDHADALDEVGKTHLARVRTAATRMSHLIDDLLTLSKTTRGTLRREQVNLGDQAAIVLEELRRRDPERAVRIEIEPGMTVRADVRLLQIVLENLLGNAWKFSARREQARIQVGKQGDAYFVRDNGAGFDLAFAKRLFQPFQRLHTKNEFDGTGIGLATVQRIVHRHGGRVWAEAAVDEGATFYFTLGDAP